MLHMEGQKDKDIKKSLELSFFSGASSGAMTGFTQEYFTPFLLSLGAAAKEVGFLAAFPNLCASLAQLKSADFAEKLKSRKKMINIFMLLQSFAILAMVSAALFKPTNSMFFIMIVTIFAVFGALSAPSWGSLLSDLVAKEKRGAYFGWRSRILGFIIVSATFSAGFVLHLIKKVDIHYGFVIIFSLAYIFQIFALYFIGKMYEPPLQHNKEDYFSFFDFLSRLRQSNFAKFVLFVSLMSFSVNLASPFFSVLMLRDLHFDYLLYTSITVTATLTVYIMISRWGAHADKIGNLKIIKFTSPLIVIIPLLCIFSRNPVWLFFAQIFSGFVWAGFNISTSNFIFDAVSPQKRTRCIAYFNVFNGLALSTGALLGGFLLQCLPPFFGYKILTLVALSSILRLIIGIIMPLRLKEVRPVEKIDNNSLFFSVLGIKPVLGIE